jgi:hypothetical protein
MNPQLTEYAYDMIKEKAEYIPENYSISGDSVVTTSPEINLKEVFNERRKYQSAPMMKLQEDTRKFDIPIPISVKIYSDEDLFFVENENLVVCGTGDTPQDALRDFCLHIIHFFEYYKKLDKSELIGDALRLKDLYQNLLVELKE